MSASMPTQRWKQVPVMRPAARIILAFLTRSSWERGTCVHRLMGRPVRCEVARARSPRAASGAGEFSPPRPRRARREGRAIARNEDEALRTGAGDRTLDARPAVG